jgi:diaminopimelate decarboxylase
MTEAAAEPMLLGTQTINPLGHLEIGGCDTVDLAREFGTPLYVMDEATIRRNCREFLRAFRERYPYGVEVHYAGKAFLCMAMCRLIQEEGLSLDVASGGELYTALKAGFPPERIALHGNNKSLAELQMAVENGVGRIVVDNFLEFSLLEQLLEGREAPVEIAIRVAPGIDPRTHERIRTGQVDTKFGFNLASGDAAAAVAQALRMPGVRLRGIHCHVGSQLLDTQAHTDAVAIMTDFLALLKRQHSVELEELNIGGGLGIRYLREQQPPSVDEFAEQVVNTLLGQLEEKGLKPPKLLQEPGRFLVGEAGTTLYTIGAIKEVPGVRTYVAIDGGMSDNPRPQLYSARYECLLANHASRASDRVVTIAGKHCETDILIWDTRLAEPKAGDILAVQSTGAYNQAMASNYNRFRRPAVVMVRDGAARVIVERETLDDLVAHDRI